MKHLPACIVLLFAFMQHAAAQYLQFVENKGQWDSAVKFRAVIAGGLLNLKPAGYRVVLHNKSQLKEMSEYYGGHVSRTGEKGIVNLNKRPNRNFLLHSHAYEMFFLNATGNALAVPEKSLALVNNYFIGNDSSKWRSGCKVFNVITYKNVYKNIDVRYYTDNGNLKYDIIVNPGADISKLAMRFNGLDGLLLDKSGKLTMKTSVGDVYQSIPLSYQVVNNLRSKVKVVFKLDGDTVRFGIGNYDKKSPLVIDPTIVFSTFAGSVSDNWGYTATYDNAGNFFAGGIVFDPGYNPRNVGGYDQTFDGGDASEGTRPYDVALIKFNPTGTLALFATYFGGSGDEQPHSLVTDAQGNLIISGRTTSSDFPTTSPTFGPGGSFDIFLAKFSPDGLRLLGCRKFGGSGSDGVNIRPKYVNVGTQEVEQTRRNYGDDARSEVLVDGQDNIYLASCTQSADFLVTGTAFRNTLGGNQDGVFIKTSPDLATVNMCSLLGGNGADAAFVLAFSETTGNIYIAGGTTSTDMAFNASNAPQGILHNSYQGGETDGFISMLNPGGTTLLKTCYIGTAGNDMVYGVQSDKFGFPYVMGTTTNSFPVVNSPFNANNNQVNGKQFITKISAGLTSIQYSANFGKGAAIPDISPTAFLVDVCGNVYVSGWGGLGNRNYYNNQSVAGMSVTGNAISGDSDGSDFYFFVLEKNASSQLFGSFYGTLGINTAADHVDGGTSRFDRRGIIYQAVCANCYKEGTFPTITGTWSPGNPAQTGSECNEAAVKIAFELSGIFSGVRPSINGVLRDSIGCIPLKVDFADTLAMGKQYIWDFGDGSTQVTTTVPNVSYTYTTTGNYRVMLVTVDSASCNIADTSYITIKAKANPATVGLDVTKLPPCESFLYQFTNTSVPPSGFAFRPGTFTWNFGDGTVIQSDALAITHQYAATGPYTVKLYLNDTTFCNSPDSFIYSLRVASVLSARFTAPATGCTLNDIAFSNTSSGGQSFTWNFGDGNSSTEISPTHQYAFPGTYTVTLLASDNLTCNPTDDTSIVITIIDGPAASFTYTPDLPTENTPFVFTNTSLNATSYKWLFGDGDSLLTNSRLPVTHIYNTSRDYQVQLIAYNANGCTDTATSIVTAIITPLLDVPNAFSPNGDGTNDVVFVQAYGINKITWSIYNRWGQLMFTSTSVNKGWDGRFKGSLQPQDVYGYVLSVEFTDGTRLNKKGDITLLR